MDQKYFLTTLTLILIIFCRVVGCSNPEPDELVLFDFETDAELDELHWRCFTLYSISDKHTAHGDKSLKLELYPSNWPGLTPKLGVRDWRGFKAIGFDVYNPAEKDVRIAVRIDDREDYPDYADRYNRGFDLKPGINRIQIPLEALITSGTQRNLDLKKIYRFMIFMGQPKEKHVLYVDYVRLAR